MAAKVFLHIGLPKTGTSYLQSVLWSHREALRRRDVLLPGVEKRDHLWASCVVREDPQIANRHALAETSWARLVEEISAWPGDAVVSHEFFSSATAEQAHAAVADLAPAQVHIVVTARDTLDLFVSGWQEAIKNKETVALRDFCTATSDDPVVVWDWRALDLGLVLERWSAVPAEQIHVIPLARRDVGPDDLWFRFANVLGLDTRGIDPSGGFRNPSMGLVETETLRRINTCLEGFDSPLERGVWVRTYLADEKLAPRGGERFWPSPDQIADCRQRGARAVEFTRERGFDVVGSLEDLLTPDELPPRREPGSVSEAEVAAVAVDLITTLLRDVQRLTRAQRAVTRSHAAAPTSSTPPALSRAEALRGLLARLPTHKGRHSVRRAARLLTHGSPPTAA